MRAEDVRRWVDNWRAAEERGRRSGEPPLQPAAAWRQALSLFALMGRHTGWPVKPDEIRRREDASAAQAWIRLRAAYRRRA